MKLVDRWAKENAADWIVEPSPLELKVLGKKQDAAKKPVKKSQSFNEIIQKYNPYHGPDGRFTSPGAAASFTFNSRMKNANAKAIEREKARTAAAESESKVRERTVARGAVTQSQHPTASGYSGEQGIANVKEDLKKASGIEFTDTEVKSMVKAIQEYTDTEYENFRMAQTVATAADSPYPYVRNNPALFEEYRQKANEIEKFIEHSPTWSGGTLYRGITIENDKFDAFIQLHKKGALIDQRGVSSWTTSKGTAENFASSGGTIKKVMFELPGTKMGTSINHLSNTAGEQEVLISAFANAKVKSVKKDKYGVLIKLEEV